MKWFIRIIKAILIIVFLMSGIVKLSGNAQMLHDFKEVYGYSKGMMYLIGVFEVIGAIGLFVGYWKKNIGKLASSGLAIIMAGAVFTHLHSGQGMNVALTPLILLVLTLIVLFSRGGK
ncbi:DoxX family protein [Gottfriedia luciferensis]|uniref:DoxX family protein n=1 Tax=Gottfriedia luciferensis TaxID=178774 RepID=UPI000B44E23A|nr:DoxX family protein [Gottfriedia luciferensis]